MANVFEEEAARRSRTNSYHQALEHEDAEGFGSEVVDFAQYGITSSLVSGGLGILNTGIAFSNIFGAEISKFSTEDALTDMGWENTAEYYKDHQTTIDAVGFAASSLIPGTIGLKALRSIQKGLAGKDSSSKFILGMQKALIPESQAKKLRQLVQKDSFTTDARSGLIAKAAKEGFHQAAVETVFAETAILLLNNQNPSINNQDLSYFDSITANLGGAGFGFVLGTGIGGVINSTIGYSTLRKVMGDQLLEENQLYKFQQADSERFRIDVTSGDRVVTLLDQRREFQSNIEKSATSGVDNSDALVAEGRRRLDTTDSLLIEEIQKITTPLDPTYNVPEGTAKEIFRLVKDMETDDAINFMANAQRITGFDDVDIMFNPSTTSLHLIDEDHWIEGAQKLVLGDRFSSASIFQKENIANSIRNANGWAVPMDKRKLVTVREELFTKGSREEALGVLRHEVGHINTNIERVEAVVAANPLGITDELVAASRQRRPGSWAYTDELPALRQQHEDMLLVGTSSIKDLETMANEIAKREKYLTYLHEPRELLADAYAVLNTPEMYHMWKGKIPTVHDVLLKNFAIKQALGRNEVLVDLKNGAMHSVTDRTPTVADRGKLNVVNPNGKTPTVTWRDGSAKVNLEEFSILDATPDSASAHYVIAQQKPNVGGKEITVQWTNFAKLNQVRQRLIAGKHKGIVNIKMPDGNTTKLTLTDDDISRNLFDRQYEILKTEATKRIRNTDELRGNKTDSDIARIIDAGEDFVETAGAAGGTKFWSATYNPMKPTVAKVFYKVREDVANPSNMNGITDAQMRIRATQESVRSSFNSMLGNLDPVLVDMFPEAAWESGINLAETVTRATKGAGAVRTNQADYGTGESMVQLIANANANVKQTWRDSVAESMASASIAVKNDPQALAELAALDSTLRQRFYSFAPSVATRGEIDTFLQSRVRGGGTKTTQRNVQLIADRLEKAGKDWGEGTIISRQLQDTMDTILNTKRLTANMVNKLDDQLADGLQVQTIKNENVRRLWSAKVHANGTIVQGKQTVASMRGLETNVNTDVLYPGPLDTNRYQYMEFVIPKKGSGIFANGKPGIIGAPTPEALAAKKLQVMEAYGDDVLTVGRDDVNRWKELEGSYSSDLDLNDFHVDSSLQRKGVQWDVAPEPTPQLVDHYIGHMQSEVDNLVDNMTAARYAEEVQSLESASLVVGQQAQRAGKKGVSTEDAFQEQLSVMMNRSRKGKFSTWKTSQEKLDNVVSGMFNTIKSTFVSSAKGDFTKMNEVMEQYNLPKVYNDKVGEFLVQTEGINSTVAAGVIPKANGVAATLMLRLDAIQPMVNALSMPITSIPEMKHLLNSIPELQRQQALKGLAVAIPDGSGHTIPSNSRLMHQAVKDFFTKKELVKEYDELGLMPSIVQEMRDVIDTSALDPKLLRKAGVTGYNASIRKVTDFLSTPADASEGFVKFTAARMADLALTAAGVTDSSIKHMAMLTYLKRVHGNYTSAQRPGLFQGFAGQAVGLFQTYQFNLFQQLLRHVGDKQLGGASSMLGLQAGIFGAQSIPGFRLMNDYIGERSIEGNDFYNGTSDVLGDEMQEWLMYGLSSNFTKPIMGEGIALYTRGDLNPRTPFIIPTSIDEIPIYSLSTKFVSSMLTAADSVADGVPVSQVFAEALATNGVNRPLAGLGQIMSGGQVTSKGSLIASTQDLEWWTGMTKLAGSRPLDESIAIQSFYRTKGHESSRRDKINQLGVSAKKMIRADAWNGDVYDNFFNDYTAQGGNIDQFQKWTHDQAMGATESTINKLYERNNSPSGRYLQKVMGGEIEEYLDVTYE